MKKVEAKLKDDPENYYLLSAKGVLYFRQDPTVAADCFTRMLTQRPFDSHQHYNRRRCYLGMGRFHEALADLKLAIALDKEDGRKWHYLGVAYYIVHLI